MFFERRKLRAPIVSPAWIERPQLHAALRPGPRVLALVAGPGYGKTVLASQIAANWNGPVFWYACDDGDADLAVFAAHLALMTGLPEQVAAAPATPKELSVKVVEALERAGAGSLVIFDDVQVLHGSALAAFEDIVRRASATGVSFVLSGRTLPFAVHGLAARGLYASLTAADLALDEAQSRGYLAAAAGDQADSQRVAELARRIEGWPAGLALAASIPARRHDVGRPGGDGSLEVLFQYFAAEVLAALEPRERRFLLETSILDYLEVEACAAVARADDAGSLLAGLESRGLFVTRGRAGTYDVHRLFAAFLRDRFARECSAADGNALHERAAAFFARRGEAARAVEHLLAANRGDQAAEMLARIALPLFAGGRAAQLERLLAGVGPQRVAAEPVLAVARGRLEHAAGAWDQALATLARAERLARARNEPDIAAEAVRAMAPILGARGEHERLRLLLDSALALPLSGAKRTALSITLGAHLLEGGRFDEVLALFAQIGPEVAELDDLALQGIVLHNTGVAHMRRGDPFAAITFYERAENAKSAAGQRLSALLTLGNRCVALRAVGEWHEATRICQRCLDEARALGDAPTLVHALENEGALALVRGDLQRAASAFEEARAACDPSDTASLPYALHGVAMVALRSGDPAVAVAACSRAAALLRAAGDEARRAEVLVTRAQAALAAGEPAAAFDFAREALALVSRSPDALLGVNVALGACEVVARAAEKLPARCAEAARAFGRETARAALALVASREYGFLERTAPAAFAAARTLAGETAVAPPPLRVDVLGPMHVFVAGVELDASLWKRRRAREILAYLLCQGGRIVPRARLIDTFWPDSEADAASDNLRVTISALRRAIGDVVRFEAGGYRFVAPAGTAVDLERFDAAISRARGARARGEGAAARAAFAEALDVYRGELLEGLEHGTWHLRERERLRTDAQGAAREVMRDPDAVNDQRARARERLLELAPFDQEAMRARLADIAATFGAAQARAEHERWRQRYAAECGAPAPELLPPGRELRGVSRAV